MDYSEQRTESLAEHRSMVLDAARLSGGSREHDASQPRIEYKPAPVCGNCKRRSLRTEEVVNGKTFCCGASVVSG